MATLNEVMSKLGEMGMSKAEQDALKIKYRQNNNDSGVLKAAISTFKARPGGQPANVTPPTMTTHETKPTFTPRATSAPVQPKTPELVTHSAAKEVVAGMNAPASGMKAPAKAVVS